MIRPDTVETAKDRLALGFGDARTFILNADEHIVVNARGDDLDQTAGGGEGNGVIHQIFYDTEQPLLLAHHDRDAASGAGTSSPYILGTIPHLPRHDHLFAG